MRPYIAQPELEHQAPPTKVIGFELRVRAPWGAQEEVQIIPLDIELPAILGYQSWSMPCTLHTSKGDIAVNIQLPP